MSIDREKNFQIVKEFCDGLGITHYQLAAEMGRSRGYLQQICGYRDDEFIRAELDRGHKIMEGELPRDLSRNGGRGSRHRIPKKETSDKKEVAPKSNNVVIVQEKKQDDKKETMVIVTKDSETLNDIIGKFLS